MRFSLVSAVALFGCVAVAQLPAAEVTIDIKVLTTKSDALLPIVNSLTNSSADLQALLAGKGPGRPSLEESLIDFARLTLNSLGTLLGAGTKYLGNDAKKIGDAFKAFVKSYSTLLNALIGKINTVSSLPLVGPILGSPLVSVLRAAETATDTLGYALINALEDSVGAALGTDLKSIDAVLTKVTSAVTNLGGK
ncbi:hypothetical protein B0T17DRAFT_644603 [Bombardia bombarda]|uniref:Uncharacterized protein n=1 Tax=Bombardia bombarda TaxID=252184 RepID=A0AA39WHQ3_9PEZI|nr:hypothetical protein B0T17DRAFT_644603 [Bombardia bombarda]